jgi:hypothetical protein
MRAPPPGVREPEEGKLAGQRRPIDVSSSGKRGARAEQREVQEAAPVAKHPVRDDLAEVEQVEPAQHPATERDQPAVLEHAHLAPVLRLDLGRRLLERDRLGLVDRATPALHHQVRQRQVVPEAWIDLDVVRAPHGIDRAVAARDGAERRFRLPQAQLVAPVGALPVRAVRGLEPELAADIPDLGIVEVADELA